MGFWLRTFVVASLGCAITGGAVAQATDPAPVFTRARLTSVFEEEGGKVYARLKLLPRSKIPFATQTLRLTSRSQVEGIADGAWVKFTSKRIDGENTVTAIHITSECVRFQHCD